MTENSESEVFSLRQKTDDLENRLHDLEVAKTEEINESSDIGTSGDTTGAKIELPDLPPNHPFEVVYDDGSWQVFLPAGCVKVGDTAATFADSDSVSSLSNNYATVTTPATAMYCHVLKTSEDGSVSYTFSIDASSSATIDDEDTTTSVANFAVFGFDAAGDNAAEIAFQYADSVMVIGGGTSGVTSITAVEATTGDNLTDELKGEVDIEAEDGSGLLVSTIQNDEDGADPEGGGTVSLDLVGREEDDDFSVHSLKYTDSADEDSASEVKVLATDDLTVTCVSTLNDFFGPVTIEGGDKIDVTSENNVITISYNENKDSGGDEEEEDPCVHPGDGDNSGGVPEGGGDGDGGGAGGGGVNPEAEDDGTGGVHDGGASSTTHTGDDDCNCG